MLTVIPEGRHIMAVFTRRRSSAEKGICLASETTITKRPVPSGFSSDPLSDVIRESSLHPDDAAWDLLQSGIQGQALDLLADDQLAGAVEPDQVKRVLPDVDPDNGKVLDASCLLCTHGCFSLLRG
ncbi:hypothetical protein V8324_09470 [Roseovarius sp. D22-M7]